MSITGQQRQIFNQAQLLNILEGTYGSLPEEREAVDSIRGGICYMLSIYDTNYGSTAALFYYKQIANNYFKYSADYDYKFQGRAGHAGAEAPAVSGV